MAKITTLYSGLFFNPEQILKIADNYGEHLSKIIQHPHITFRFKPTEKEIEDTQMVNGKTIMVHIIGYANDGKNEGFEIEPNMFLPTDIPHITISVSEDGKPADTKDLFNDKSKVKPVDEYIIGQIGLYQNNGERSFVNAERIIK